MPRLAIKDDWTPDRLNDPRIGVRALKAAFYPAPPRTLRPAPPPAPATIEQRSPAGPGPLGALRVVPPRAVGPMTFLPFTIPSYSGRVRSIQVYVARAYGVRLEQLIGPVRTANFVRPRQVAMYLCRTLIPRHRMSLPDIGRRFGGRDHTTVLHGVRRIAGLIERDAEVAAMIARMSEDCLAILASTDRIPAFEGGRPSVT